MNCKKILSVCMLTWMESCRLGSCARWRNISAPARHAAASSNACASGNILHGLTVLRCRRNLPLVSWQSEKESSACQRKKSFFPWSGSPSSGSSIYRSHASGCLCHGFPGMSPWNVHEQRASLSGNRQTPVAAAENLDGFEWFSLHRRRLGSAYLTLA